MEEKYILKQYKNCEAKELNFTAIDFETATLKEKYPCQIGLAIVRNGQIVKRISRYIKPPYNYYLKSCINVHHITPEITQNEPSFDDVWYDIKEYIEGEFLVAHNASFDILALENILNYYWINLPILKGYACTKNIFGGISLDVACKMYEIKLDNHHDGCCDACACAKLYLAYVNNIEPKHKKEEISKEVKNVQLNFFNDSFLTSHAPLKGDILKKDLSGADPQNPFYDRKVVITGIFTQERKNLGLQLKSMGADINIGITKKTNYVLIGEDPGLKKIEKVNKLIHDGYKIRKLYQKDIDAILSGDWEGYHATKEVKKDIDLTIEHYNKHHIGFEGERNIIASKELYYGKGFAGNFDLFNQITGNLGACGDNEIYPETNICVLSDFTINKLKVGEKDETILYIQNLYNSNRSITFDFQFISESEILAFCTERCKKYNDEVTSELYDKYIASTKEAIPVK